MITLFEKKNNCCGCSACVNICPKGAIKLEPDENGFLFPQLDNEKCIECKLCKTACAFQNTDEKSEPLAAYAAQVKSEEEIKKSTSGGLFAALAKEIISKGGAIFGAAFERTEEGFTARHIKAETGEELLPLLKSKYLQSSTEAAFAECKAELKDGRLILFSGTPCQIAGLKAYLKKDYENLITADIVCHGVPSNQIFNKYIKWLEAHTGARVADFQFRNKKHGWELHNMAVLEYPDGHREELVFGDDDIKYCYMHHFLELSFLRDSCYTCKYAGKNRPADITLGDYWGINRTHPEWLFENGGKLHTRFGISCVIVNTEKGASLFESIKSRLIFYESSFEDIAENNTQLREPARLPESRGKTLKSIAQNGFDDIAREYQKHLDFERFKLKIKGIAPKGLWAALKAIKGRIKG